MKILVVDDDALNRRVLRALLIAEGHAVVEGEDGLSALQLLQREKIDAVISDILMPRMDGYRLCSEIRKNESLNSMPFIAYTATYTSASDEKVALDFGADKFIRKPASAEVIIKAVHEAVQTRGTEAKQLKQPDELLAMREYSEALVRKLEKKNIDLAEANKALAESESHVRTILDSEPDCVMIINRDGELVEMNRAGLVMIEVDSAEQILGKSIYAFIVPEHREAFREMTEAVFQGESRTLEFEIVTLNGTRRCLETRTVPFKNATAEIVSCLGIARDITESKRAEAALRQVPLEKIRWRKTRIVKDLGIITFLGVAVFAAAEHFELFQIISRWLLTHQETELDDLILMLACLAFAFAFFSYRRWAELKVEMIGRTKAQEALRALHGELEVRVQERTADLAKSNEALRTEIAERKQTQEMAQVNLERIRALHDIDTAITSTLDLHAVLNVLLEKIDKLVPLGAVISVRLLNGERGELAPAACRNIDESEWRAERPGPGGGAARRALETRKPALIRNVQIDPETQDAQFARKHNLVSRLVVPLIAKERPHGVLSFYTREEHEFTGEEIELFVTLAGQGAIAIHNAQLYEETKRSKGELESINRRLEKTLKELSGFYTALSPLAPSVRVGQPVDGRNH